MKEGEHLIKKLLTYGFIILISGIVMLVIGIDRLSYLDGIGGLALAFQNNNLYRIEVVVFVLVEGWGIGALIAGATMLFLSIYPFESGFNLTKLHKYGKAALLGAAVIGIIFSGAFIYSVVVSQHGPLKATLAESGNSFASTSNVTVTYTLTATGGVGPNNYTWYVFPCGYNVNYTCSGQYSSKLIVTYHAYEMNPNFFFHPSSPENFTVQVTVIDQLGKSITSSTITEVSY